MKRREFLKKAGVGAAAAVAATTVNAPYVIAKKKIRWRMQTYAGASLAEHVCKPSIDAFNKAANGEMMIDLYNADQLVPQGELFSSPLLHATFWIFLPCFTGMGWTKSGRKPMLKSQRSPG